MGLEALSLPTLAASVGAALAAAGVPDSQAIAVTLTANRRLLALAASTCPVAGAAELAVKAAAVVAATNATGHAVARPALRALQGCPQYCNDGSGCCTSATSSCYCPCTASCTNCCSDGSGCCTDYYSTCGCPSGGGGGGFVPPSPASTPAPTTASLSVGVTVYISAAGAPATYPYVGTQSAPAWTTTSDAANGVLTTLSSPLFGLQLWSTPAFVAAGAAAVACCGSVGATLVASSGGVAAPAAASSGSTVSVTLIAAAAGGGGAVLLLVILVVACACCGCCPCCPRKPAAGARGAVHSQLDKLPPAAPGPQYAVANPSVGSANPLYGPGGK